MFVKKPALAAIFDNKDTDLYNTLNVHKDGMKARKDTRWKRERCCKRERLILWIQA